MPSTLQDRIDGITSSVAVKAPVLVATVGAITLSGLQTVDGVVLAAGDRVLVKDQSSAVDNGIYIVSATAWERAPDFDGARDIKRGTQVLVNSGTVNAGSIYKITTADTITIGSSSIAFGLYQVSTNFLQPLTGATTRTVQSKLQDIVSVVDFGADPTGGSDSYAAFTAAMTAAKSVFVPIGTYSLSATIRVPDQSGLLGYGSGSVTLQKYGSSALTHLVETAPGTLNGSTVVQNSGIRISGITIVVDNTNSNGLKVQGCTRSIFEDIKITGAATVSNFLVTSTLLSTSPLKSAFSNRNAFTHCNSVSAVIGFLQRQATGDTSASIGNENTYFNCQSQNHTSYGFKNESGEAVRHVLCAAFTSGYGTTMYYTKDAVTFYYSCKADSSAFPTTSGSPNIYGFQQGQWAASDAAWVTGHVYAPGAAVTSNGYRLVTAAGGTSGANEPGLAKNPFAAAVTDGGVTDWVHTLPSSSTYNIGYYFDTGSTDSAIFGVEGLGCYQMITGVSDTVMKTITVVGRNQQNTIPNVKTRTQFTLWNSDWQFNTWTPDSAGFSLDLDAGGYNTSGNVRQKILVNGTEKIRFNYGFTGSTSSIMLGKQNTGVSNQGVSLNDNVASNFTIDGGTVIQLNRLTSDGTLANFMTAGTTRGSISIAGATTSYNTSSAFDLKFNIDDIVGATSVFKNIRWRSFEFKDRPGTVMNGVIAEECMQTYPQVVSPPRDDYPYPMVDYSKFVPIIGAALKEALARIDQLEAQVAALQ